MSNNILSINDLDASFLCAQKIPLVQDALQIIREDIQSKYCYHSELHTLDVIKEVLLFGKEENLSEQELYILVIAAAWHDIGFKKHRENHEEISAQAFLESTKKLGTELSNSDIQIIAQLIRDTKLYQTEDGVVQIPTTELSKYLLDADLSNLGRADFFDCLDLLCMEHQAETYDFYRRTLGFITRHTWHTESAKKMRLQQEILNTTELARRILDEKYLLAD